jgi:hypothetical protein
VQNEGFGAVRYLQRGLGAAFLLCAGVLLTFWAVKGAAPSSSSSEVALYSVAGLAALGWVATEASQRHYVKRAMLDIIRVDIVPGTDDDPFPLLDITVCNRGGATAVLHELLIEDTKVWVFARRGGPSARPVSWTYDIDIGAEPPRHWRISQSVEPNNTDRFQVRLGLSRWQPPGQGLFVYTFRVSLILDKDARAAEVGMCVAVIPQPILILGYHHYPLTVEELTILDTRAEELESLIANAAVVQPQATESFASVRDEIDKYKTRWAAQGLVSIDQPVPGKTAD